MPVASLHAIALDLLAEEPDRARPTVEEAIRACPRGAVVAARGADGCELAVCVLEDGRRFALPDVCPHDGGRLSDGFVERGRLVCGRHGWEFDPATGLRLWPPRGGS